MQQTLDEEVDGRNAAAVARSAHRSWAEVLADFRRSYEDLRAQTEALTEEAFSDPDWFAWMEGEPVWRGIGGESFGHYGEHEPEIRAWLEQS